MTEKEFLNNQGSFLECNMNLFSNWRDAVKYSDDYLIATRIFVGIEPVRENTLTLVNGRIFEK